MTQHKETPESNGAQLNGNGLKIKISKPFQVIIWILGIVFMCGTVYLQVQANTDGIKYLNIKTNDHDKQLSEIKEFNRNIEKQVTLQTERYDKILEGIGELKRGK